MAAVGKIKVVSVDYRLAPEHRFPAAGEDVETVYRALLKEHKPGNIGIYGCSAGGILVAQAVAQFQKARLPRPGAIGIFCSGALRFEGDSSHWTQAIAGGRVEVPQILAYIREKDLNDPLAYPALSTDILRGFPGTLLISGTRDRAMSSVIVTHSRLVALGVPARLHIWEGMGHGFLYDPDLPESREAYEVVAHFFHEHLGRR